jgi:hypothetical protein
MFGARINGPTLKKFYGSGEKVSEIKPFNEVESTL